MSETLGVCALVLSAEVRVWFAVCILAEGHCACSDSTDLGRLSAQATPSLSESVNTSALNTLPSNHR